MCAYMCMCVRVLCHGCDIMLRTNYMYIVSVARICGQVIMIFMGTNDADYLTTLAVFSTANVIHS